MALHKLTNEEVDVIAAQHAFSNPFWSDDHVWSSDPTGRLCAECLVAGSQLRSIRRRIAWLIGILYVIVEIFVVISWSSSIDWYFPENGPLTSWVIALFLGQFLIAPILVSWVAAPLRVYRKLAETISLESRQRYESWKATLPRLDPTLYSQVLTWEQNETILEAQNRLARAAERAALAARENIEYSKQTARNTSAIRDNLPDPQWGRFGGDDWPGNSY